MQPVVPSSTDVTVSFVVLDATTFLPYESLTHATAGLALWYRKGATGAVTAITESTLTNLTDAHSDGGLKHIDDGVYRLDLPDAAIPTAENEVTVWGGTATGYIILGGAIIGKATANATAPDNASITAIKAKTDNLPSDPADQSAVEAAIAAGDDATLAAIAALNNLSSAQAQTAAAAALTAYDPPTHAELTSGFAAADDAVLAAIAALSIPSAAAVASAVWSAVTRTLTSSGALSQDDIDDIVAAVVAAITAAAQSDSITTDGTTVTRRRGDSWTVAFTGLGSIANRTKLWLTIKRDPSHTDAVAELAVTEAGGLITLAGDAIASPIVAADGDLEVTDAAAGDVTLTVTAAATALLEAAGGRFYDLQVLRSTGAVETLTSGRWAVVSDVTRATS